jgi:hypothetical protein
MPTIAERIAELDRRIIDAERHLTTLDREVASMDASSAAVPKLRMIMFMAEVKLSELRDERAQLEEVHASTDD